MKKIFSLALLAVFLLCSCGSAAPEAGEVYAGQAYVDEKNDELMLSIVDALERQDSAGLLALFIPLAREEAIDIEGGAALLLSLYQGSMAGWERIEGYRDESNNAGSSVLRSMSHYRITTNQAQYSAHV